MDESPHRRSVNVLPPNVERFLVELFNEPPRHGSPRVSEKVPADYGQHFYVANAGEDHQARDHVNFLKMWTDENVDQQLPNPEIAEQLANKFMK